MGSDDASSLVTCSRRVRDSVGMAEFTREEILAKLAAGESLEKADLSDSDLSGTKLITRNLKVAHELCGWRR